ncbi:MULTISPECIES: hypothetical protein [Streptomyces]|uniref:Toxin n=1 Tax=Streptomyces glycanivorans TaxID=3033808 RepID=A0ABY9JMT8_9ACTN|nr:MULTISPECIES: hypothetical protein [unclassified Streptomyces]WSQ82436.1 hypothetical protein OG725_24830 [Streptomyces sp. NBC_01213]WLQ69050.1 hypothetical protein P8A20_25415 [Streptomyces sp. Alt3]WSQ89756.1 hypothetical protein OG722_25265 [Streptomyces sp. NBC_01212]WSR11266.1 hypothetical protein OG265_11195 [Streptomyces sp. NBC_01208]WSR53099.1 hypothetical protein OG279_25620 [Streptomyces sp. NBC_01201]
MKRTRRQCPGSDLTASALDKLRARRKRRVLRHETERLVASMPIPRPFDLDRFVANIEQARGRRIVLKPMPAHLANLTGFCGLWIKHDTRPLDLILHVQGGSPSHERQIKVHELVHLWAEDATGVVGTDEVLRDLTPARVEQLVATGQAAGRRRYDTAIEKRTEDAAALISRRADSPDLIEDSVARRLAEDFAYPFGSDTPSTE